MRNNVSFVSAENSTASVTATSKPQYGSQQQPIFWRRPNVSKTTGTRSSVQRAIDQVHAVLDLYNSSSGISADIALSAVEGVVARCCSSSCRAKPATRTLPQSPPPEHQTQVLDNIPEQLLALLWRAVSLKLSPSSSIFESFWRMLELQKSLVVTPANVTINYVKPSKQVGRCVNLLKCWYQSSRNLRQEVEVVPQTYFETILAFAVLHHVTMSFAVYELYRYFFENIPQPPRSIFSLVLKMLAYSSSEWKVRQMSVLRDMLQLNTDLTNMTSAAVTDVINHGGCSLSYGPTLQELQLALQCAAKAGRAQDAAWIMCLLSSENDLLQFQPFFLEALLHCNEPGSTVYMERYVLNGIRRNGDDAAQGSQALQMVLQKWASSCLIGAGMRAEAVWNQWLDLYRSANDQRWKPTVDATHLVIEAYLSEPSVALANIISADHFVRKVVADFGLAVSALSLMLDKSLSRLKTGARPVITRPATMMMPRIFHRLLEAYSAHFGTVQAREAAERLYQFFLLQHRRGRISEEPDRFHLAFILRIWNKQALKAAPATAPTVSSMSTTTAAVAAAKCLEYYRILQNLHENKLVSTGPDCFNARQVLGALARSEQEGYGKIADEIFQNVLIAMKNSTASDHVASASFPARNRYAMGHMFWCVIKCWCNDKQFDRALETIDQMETMYAQKNSNVKLTGASYQTVLRSLAVKSKSSVSTLRGNSAAVAAEVIRRIERQYFELDNKRARLTKSLYLDAIRCCEKGQDDDLVARYREKMNQLEQTEQ